MCGSSTPPPPDPYKTAQAQYVFNKQAAEDALRLNAINQTGPFGSTTYQRDPKTGLPTSQQVSLSPEVQQWLSSQFGASSGLNNAAARQIANLPTDKYQLPGAPNSRTRSAEAFGADAIDPTKMADPSQLALYESEKQALGPTSSTADIARTSYDQQMALQQPNLDAMKKQKEVELANRGIPVGSEIWRDEINRLDSAQAGAQNAASRQAILDSGAEQSRQFGMNLQTGEFGAGEDARLAKARLGNQQFLGTQQNQDFNRMIQALGYGRGEYQTDLSNDLLERSRPYEEAAALLGTAPQFTTPQFMNPAQQNVAAPDYTGIVNNNYNQQLAASQANQGGLFKTIAGLGGTAMQLLSDENAKTDRKTADGEAILAALRKMPVDNYRYKDEAREEFDLPEHRTGPMAQDYAKHFGGDGKTIDVGDAMGKLFAAMKALDKRTARQKEYA